MLRGRHLRASQYFHPDLLVSVVVDGVFALVEAEPIRSTWYRYPPCLSFHSGVLISVANAGTGRHGKFLMTVQ